jgi:hypothetical protein
VAGGNISEGEIEALVSAAVTDLDGSNANGDGEEERASIWRLADAVARAGNAAPDQINLVSEILEALARRAEPRSGRYRRGPRR